jgi:phosphoglycerate dehydrogenase-like enzyme
MNEPIDVLMTMQFPEELIEKIQAVSSRLKIRVVIASKPEEIPSDVWATAEVLYTNKVVPEPGMVPNLRWIQFHWAGVNHVADAPLLNQPGMVATTLSGANATQMGEYIVMMLLALGHRLPEMLDYQRRIEWPKDRWERFSPYELRGRTVGIVGYGSIGRQVARLIYPFGGRVLATKRDVMHPADTGYMPDGFGDPSGDYVQRLYPAEALRSMAKEADFLVITVPLTPETLNLIGAPIFSVMKPTAYLIDVSRGGIVDHEALITALREKQIAGAALDVFPEEPLPPESPLWKLPNVLLTPHISGNTPIYDTRAIELFVDNLKRYIAGLPLYNRFDPELGY